ncbi:DapH/DapD/GlmU-related protein [Fibrella arboris]|uniref:DapH/DapD/GlmU-related protein n=1 Tax=Fibrella arboris TaxID=3242486 RepID=UPI003521FAC8
MIKSSNGRFFIDPSAKIGVPLRFLQGCVVSKHTLDNTMVRLPKSLYIGPYAIIGENVTLGENTVIDAFCKVSSSVSIGKNTLLIYRAMVGGEAIIGEDCVIGGVIPERGIIGNRCKVFGNLVHTHNDSTMSWDHHEVPEPSVTINDDCFIGFGAQVIGGFEVGPKSYICSGAIITKCVPPYHIASGVNKIVHYSKWKGDLRNNPIFLQE